MMKKCIAVFTMSVMLIGCSAETDEKVEEKEPKVVEESTKEPEAQGVSTISNDLEYQKQLEKGFELDMESLDEYLNQIQFSLKPIVIEIAKGGTLAEQDYPLLITNLETMIFFLDNMRDYSELDKYKNSYAYLEEGNEYLNKAYIIFNSFFKESNQDADTFKNIFFEGFEIYNLALEKYKQVGKTYAQEYMGNAIETSNTDNVSPITMTNEDAPRYWKGNEEIITGNDWLLLSEEEKEQVVQLIREGFELSTDVPMQRNNEEYVLLLDMFFAVESNRNEDINGAIAGAIMMDIEKTN